MFADAEIGPICLLICFGVSGSINGQDVTGIVVDSTSPYSVTLSWTSIGEWDYYFIRVLDPSNNTAPGYPVNVTGTTAELDHLFPATEYDFLVTPWTNAGLKGRVASLVGQATDAAIPDEGVILVSEVTSSAAFLRWRDYGAPFYSLAFEPVDAVAGTAFITDTFVEVTILQQGIVINVTLSGFISAAFTEVAFTQIRSVPASPPDTVSLNEISVLTANVSWSSPPDPHDAYEVYVTNIATAERTLKGTIPRDNNIMDYSYIVPGLTPATNYTFEVGTVLNLTGSFPLQRSDQSRNPTVIGETVAATTMEYDTPSRFVTSQNPASMMSTQEEGITNTKETPPPTGITSIIGIVIGVLLAGVVLGGFIVAVCVYIVFPKRKTAQATMQQDTALDTYKMYEEIADGPSNLELKDVIAADDVQQNDYVQ